MALREAKESGKIFFQENERICPYLQAMETMVREMETMTVATPSLQTDLHDHFFPMRAAAVDSPAAGGQTDLSAALQLCVYSTLYSGLT